MSRDIKKLLETETRATLEHIAKFMDQMFTGEATVDNLDFYLENAAKKPVEHWVQSILDYKIIYIEFRGQRKGILVLIIKDGDVVYSIQPSHQHAGHGHEAFRLTIKWLAENTVHYTPSRII